MSHGVRDVEKVSTEISSELYTVRYKACLSIDQGVFLDVECNASPHSIMYDV